MYRYCLNFYLIFRLDYLRSLYYVDTLAIRSAPDKATYLEENPELTEGVKRAEYKLIP